MRALLALAFVGLMVGAGASLACFCRLQPSEGLSPERSKPDCASGAVLPFGPVGGALACAVRRRTRTA